MSRNQITPDELMRCWKWHGVGYVELQKDGNARLKYVDRGTSGDYTGKLTWEQLSPTEFEVNWQGDAEGYRPRQRIVYRVKYFDGKTLELWIAVIDRCEQRDLMLTQPEVWMKSKLPKSWETHLNGD